MSSNHQNIALLLFTRTPKEEVQHKKLLPQGGKAQQFEVAHKFILHSQELLAATGLPYFIITSEKQKGNLFGERLYHAFAQVFGLGYDQVIAIGNDCPQLNAADIITAAKRLPASEVVLGPGRAGGIYLLGLNRRVFERCNSFDTIRWNSAATLTDLKDYFRRTASFFILPEKYADINSGKDLFALVKKKLLPPPLLRFIKQRLFLIKRYFPEINIFFFIISSLRPLVFRGPPSTASGL